MVLIYSFLVISDIEHLFIYQLAFCMSSQKMSNQVLCQFCNWVICFLEKNKHTHWEKTCILHQPEASTTNIVAYFLLVFFCFFFIMKIIFKFFKIIERQKNFKEIWNSLRTIWWVNEVIKRWVRVFQWVIHYKSK